MSPHPIEPAQLREWLLDLAKNPLSEDELREVSSPENPQENPELALQLGQDGTPIWWPQENPATLKPLRPGPRAQWFRAYLADELSPAKEILKSGGPRSRRQTLARCLLLIQSTINFAEVPTPDSL